MATIISIVDGKVKFHRNTTLAKVRQLIPDGKSFSIMNAEPNTANKITDVNDVNINDVLLYDDFIGKVIFFDDGHFVTLESIESLKMITVDSRKCLWLRPASELKGFGLPNIK